MAYGESGRASTAKPAPARFRRQRLRRTPEVPEAGGGCCRAPAPPAPPSPAFRCRYERTAGIFGDSRKTGNCRGDRASRAGLRARAAAAPPRHRGRDTGLDAIEGVDRDSLALAQPLNQLAIIHSTAAEGRFRHVGLATEFGDLAQDLVVFHRIEGLGRVVGQPLVARMSYHHLPTLGHARGYLSPAMSGPRKRQKSPNWITIRAKSGRTRL